MRPINPDSNKEVEITAKEFFDRWRNWGGMEEDIQRMQANTEDFDVF